MKLKSSSRLTLVAIAALFILPLLLAWLMFNGTIGIKPGKTHSYGELVQPPVTVDWQGSLVSLPGGDGDTPRGNAALFEGHWVIVHVVPDQCQSPCLNAIRNLRQVHKASGRDQQRIQVAMILPNAGQQELAATLESMYPNFQLFHNPDVALQRVLESTASNFSAQSPGSSYLIDPIGNIMLFYPAGFDPNDLNKDLKRLLKWSKLDK